MLPAPLPLLLRRGDPPRRRGRGWSQHRPRSHARRAHPPSRGLQVHPADSCQKSGPVSPETQGPPRVLFDGGSRFEHTIRMKGFDRFHHTEYEEGAGEFLAALDREGFEVTYVRGHEISSKFPKSGRRLALLRDWTSDRGPGEGRRLPALHRDRRQGTVRDTVAVMSVRDEGAPGGMLTARAVDTF